MKKIINYFKSTSKQTNWGTSIKKYDAVIHIGAPKTGSSAIQKFLLENRDSLTKNGFFYPEHEIDENGISGGHSELVQNLINNDNEKAQTIFNEYMRRAKAKELTLLLSAESFFNHHEKVASFMQGYSCKIVVFFREPIEALFSNYNQSIKRHFNTVHIFQICNNALLNNNTGNSSIYGRWTDSFGKENVTILEYNLDYFKKHSVQEVFLTHIGLSKQVIEQIKPKKFEQINKSYSLAELEFKRVLNHVLDKENKKENHDIDLQLQMLSDAKQEKHTLMDELSVQMYEKLYEKFKQARIKLVEDGMVCFNHVKYEKKEHKQNNYLFKEKINDIIGIAEHFKNEKPEIYRYIVSRILEYIKHQKNLSCDVINLAEWFNIDMEAIPNRSESWFSQAQLNKMAEGNYKEADFLRDIAIILLTKSDVYNANKIISRALELRPNGPGLIKLKQTITEYTESK